MTPNSRSYLNRWAQPDAIVPGVGEGGNPNAVGYVEKNTYSPLTVGYHEVQFLEQVNLENRKKLVDPQFRLPPVPTNPIAFDRYAYSLNNPIRYIDPSGHNPLLALALIPPVGWVVIGVATAAVVVYFAVPGVREGVTEGLENGLDWTSTQVSAGINTVFSRRRYVGDPRPAGDIIAQEKKGSISQEFPSQYLGKTFDQIAKDAAKGIKEAIKAKKLLGDNRFDKHQKKGEK